MKGLSRKFDCAANVIYRAAIDEEKEWRQEGNTHDIAIIDELLVQVQGLGYNYKYFADITNRENTETDFLDLLLGYIGRFNDDYFSAVLVGVVGKKGNTSATETILNNYMGLSDDNKRKHAGFYDNALNRIKDKRYIPAYMEFLKVPEDAIKLPLTMIMLGKWQKEEAKLYFLKYVDADSLGCSEGVSNLVYISLEALSYYQDPDGMILNALECKLNTENKDLLRVTQKAIKRLCK